MKHAAATSTASATIATPTASTTLAMTCATATEEFGEVHWAESSVSKRNTRMFQPHAHASATQPTGRCGASPSRISDTLPSISQWCTDVVEGGGGARLVYGRHAVATSALMRVVGWLNRGAVIWVAVCSSSFATTPVQPV